MIKFNTVLEKHPFCMLKQEKTLFLNETLKQLTLFHYKNCDKYKKILDSLDFNPNAIDNYYNIPFLPVSLFKELDLLSVNRNDVFKIMTSSGTTGQAVSKIYLDKTTAVNQQKILVKIVSDFIGSSRIPMLIIDSPSVIKDRANFSARGAGILGFSIFGTDITYALDDNMKINISAIENFLEKHKTKQILLFGFTFMIWQHFYKELKKLNNKIDFSRSMLIHGGGWKKLINESVSRKEFKKALKDICGLTKVYDYYGMVEQTGCVYMECEYEHLHSSIFSDVITRRYNDFSSCNIGEKGIVQVVSILPQSYPGHSLLTEDEGIILGEDDCPCGRKGKYFQILGRLGNAEIRGCSDTYAAKFR